MVAEDTQRIAVVVAVVAGDMVKEENMASRTGHATSFFSLLYATSSSYASTSMVCLESLSQSFSLAGQGSFSRRLSWLYTSLM